MITWNAMIDVKITFQDDEVLYEDHEKYNLISEFMLKTFYDNLKPRRRNLLDKV